MSSIYISDLTKFTTKVLQSSLEDSPHFSALDYFKSRIKKSIFKRILKSIGLREVVKDVLQYVYSLNIIFILSRGIL
jgi:hypothetical protein